MAGLERAGIETASAGTAAMTPLTEAVVIGAVAMIAILLIRWLSWLALRLLIRASRGLSMRLVGLRSWFHHHPWHGRFATRYPGAYRWLRARLGANAFTGLPLTLLIAAAVYLAALLGGLIEDVINHAPIVHLDRSINRDLAAWRSPLLLDSFIWITDLGASSALFAVAAMATGLLWTGRRATLIGPLWVAFLGAEATTHVGKYVLDRPRPEMLEIATEWTSSFPSGHATGAAAVYGFLAFAIARELPIGGRAQFEVVFWIALLIVLIGFSRMFLSVHYLSDVLAGLLVGGFWLLVGFALAEWRRMREARTTAPPAPRLDRQGELS